METLSHLVQSNARLFRKFQEARKLRPHKTCALMLEVRGREIRTNEIDENCQAYVAPSEENKFRGGVYLRPGQQLQIATDDPVGQRSNNQKVQCYCKELPRLVRPNDVIYIDDGKIVCLVTECEQVRKSV